MLVFYAVTVVLCPIDFPFELKLWYRAEMLVAELQYFRKYKKALCKPVWLLKWLARYVNLLFLYVPGFLLEFFVI